ncbi:DUF6252 family protein [Dyadobacter sp. CY312]|uniref:DUF6252 family protein n=1 Tax=Dyadobacter sp. CY312 TaxID=2907303 RepID=UPI001F240297|nr:DUF6252 family protein [Dyadobacter sp. CY312]MCE7040812.1 DUF6252 family protein [Dyadobacter sp. CY312]
MKNVNLYITALAVLILFWGCDKGPELTPISQEGKNTFSCKVNGKVWIPDGTGDIFVNIKPIYGVYYYNSLIDTIYVNIETNSSSGEQVQLFLRTFDVGVHMLDDDTQVTGSSFYPKNYGFYSFKHKNYITSKEHTGSITISKSNISSGILSGTFEFTATSATGESVHITEGRFDLNHKTL